MRAQAPRSEEKRHSLIVWATTVARNTEKKHNVPSTHPNTPNKNAQHTPEFAALHAPDWFFGRCGHLRRTGAHVYLHNNIFTYTYYGIYDTRMYICTLRAHTKVYNIDMKQHCQSAVFAFICIVILQFDRQQRAPQRHCSIAFKRNDLICSIRANRSIISVCFRQPYH